MEYEIKIMPNDKGTPSGQLADAELYLTEGLMAGNRLLGIAVWDRRNGPGRNVTFPSRAYSVNGERRNFSLLRAYGDNQQGQERVRDAVLEAYARFEEQAAVERI